MRASCVRSFECRTHARAPAAISTAAQRTTRFISCGTTADHADAGRYTLTRSFSELVAEEAAARGARKAADQPRSLATRSGRRITGAAVGRIIGAVVRRLPIRCGRGGARRKRNRSCAKKKCPHYVSPDVRSSIVIFGETRVERSHSDRCITLVLGSSNESNGRANFSDRRCAPSDPHSLTPAAARRAVRSRRAG
jgi:hypothetical protein